VDRGVIESKLESLRRCVRRIEQRVPDNAAALASDLDAQDIISLNLTRAVQLCVDIAAHIIAAQEQVPPTTMGESFDRLAEMGVLDETLARRLKKAVGFRNLAIHNYGEIDWNIVYAIVTRRLDDFRDFARAVARLL